jgi:hypothetical protein
MRAAPVLIAASALLCCNSPASGPPPPGQPPAVPIPTLSAGPEPESVAPASTPEPSASAVSDSKSWIPGEPVVARGRISNTPWQHLIGHVAGKQADYFDLEDGGQTVVYLAKPISCPGLVEVAGTVKEVRGSSKRPGGPDTKVDDSYGELHIDVDSHRCL